MCCEYGEDDEEEDWVEGETENISKLTEVQAEEPRAGRLSAGELRDEAAPPALANLARSLGLSLLGLKSEQLFVYSV
jgi:hypothetical protein